MIKTGSTTYQYKELSIMSGICPSKSLTISKSLLNRNPIRMDSERGKLSS